MSHYFYGGQKQMAVKHNKHFFPKPVGNTANLSQKVIAL